MPKCSNLSKSATSVLTASSKLPGMEPVRSSFGQRFPVLITFWMTRHHQRSYNSKWDTHHKGGIALRHFQLLHRRFSDRILVLFGLALLLLGPVSATRKRLSPDELVPLIREVIALMPRIEDPEKTEEIRWKVASHIARLPPSVALEFARSIPDIETRAEALSRIAWMLPGDLIIPALQLSDSIPSPLHRASVRVELARRLVHLEGLRGFWLVDRIWKELLLLPDSDRERLYGMLILSVGQVDPERAFALLSRVDTDPSRILVLIGEIFAYQGNLPRVLYIGDLIEDPIQRASYFKKVAYTLVYKDSSAARILASTVRDIAYSFDDPRRTAPLLLDASRIAFLADERLAHTLILEADRVSQQIPAVDDRDDWYSKLVSFCDLAYPDLAFDFAQRIQNPEKRADALLQIIGAQSLDFSSPPKPARKKRTVFP